MFGAILKATNSSFQKGMTFCRSIYVKKVIKLLAFIFEQPSYVCVQPVCKINQQIALLSCQPRVTVTSRIVYKVIRDLESIDHLIINPIHRIRLIQK